MGGGTAAAVGAAAAALGAAGCNGGCRCCRCCRRHGRRRRHSRRRRRRRRYCCRRYLYRSPHTLYMPPLPPRTMEFIPKIQCTGRLARYKDIPKLVPSSLLAILVSILLEYVLVRNLSICNHTAHHEVRRERANELPATELPFTRERTHERTANYHTVLHESTCHTHKRCLHTHAHARTRARACMACHAPLAGSRRLFVSAPRACACASLARRQRRDSPSSAQPKPHPNPNLNRPAGRGGPVPRLLGEPIYRRPPPATARR